MRANHDKIKVKRSLELLEENCRDALNYEISYLDDALLSVTRSELIAVGAYEGQGKTDLATHIAYQNAKLGRHVFMFALEADRDEIQRRVLFKYASQQYFREVKKEYIEVRYSLFAKNKIDRKFYKYIDAVTEKVEKELSTLTIINRQDATYTIKDFIREVDEIDMDADLILVDHITFFDSTTATQTDRAKLSEAIKHLRNITITRSIPIIVVTHLHRPDRSNKRLIPANDDIFGCSDIEKESIATVFIERDNETKPINKSVIPFFIRVGKNRFDGSVVKYMASMNYNIETNCYESGYTLLKLKNGDTEFEIIEPKNLPTWAKGAKNERKQTSGRDDKVVNFMERSQPREGGR